MSRRYLARVWNFVRTGPWAERSPFAASVGFGLTRFATRLLPACALGALRRRVDCSADSPG
jgi:hypothetical protein